MPSPLGRSPPRGADITSASRRGTHVLVLDEGTHKVVADITGLTRRRLFIACQGTTPVGLVMNADTGKVVASMRIGGGSDRVGVVNIFHEDLPDKYSKVTEVRYMYGARTVALDSKTHHIFSVGTTQNGLVPPTQQNPNPRPRPVAATFSIVEVGR